MVNHPNRKRTEPNHMLADVARAAGATVSLAWEIPGPKDTGIAWLSMYFINRSVCIVQTFKDGNGWDAFTPCGSVDVETTIADVLNRCGVPVPEKSHAYI